jgi:prophage antirepressor-like protein
MNTMNSLVPFAFEDSLVRVHMDEKGEPWFVAKDVARALEYAEASNPARICAHVPEEWKGVKRIHTPGGEQEMLCLTEQGLYFFVARSDKSRALPFQKWIAGDMLPALRKTGTYSVSGRDGRDTLSTGKDRWQLREMMREWSRRSGYEEQVLLSVIRTHFHVPRISMLTLGQLPMVHAFIFSELEILSQESGGYILPVNRAPAYSVAGGLR